MTDQTIMNKQKKIKKIVNWNVPHSIRNNIYCFLPGERIPEKTAGGGILGWLQNVLKANGKLYYTLLHAFGPVCVSMEYRRVVKQYLKKYDEESTILNLGSGPSFFYGRQDIINLDVFELTKVDIVADACSLPIEDGTVDFVISIAMLEHVVNPEDVVQEIRRILKPGGDVFAYVPFVQPYHAAPYDFSRWNHQGLRKLFSEFDIRRIFIGAGPTSGMLYVLEEWLSILLSFGSKTLHDIWFLFFMLLLFPVKYIDFFFNRFALAENAAGGFGIVARKER